jgi:hypothetical protein
LGAWLRHSGFREREPQVFGAPFVASDSLPSPEIEAGHEGDTYNRVDPEGLPRRLAAAGFTKVEVKTNQFGWASLAKKA